MDSESFGSAPEDGLYPIHLAAIEGKYQIVRALLASNVDSESRWIVDVQPLECRVFFFLVSGPKKKQDVFVRMGILTAKICINEGIRACQGAKTHTGIDPLLLFGETLNIWLNIWLKDAESL